MRVGLAVLFVLCGVASAAGLEREDLGSVEQAFKKKDPALDWFHAREKKPLDSMRSLLTVDASQKANAARAFGVFIVSGPDDRVDRVLDIFSGQDAEGVPEMEQPDKDSVSLHFYGDYGMYGGSVRYFYAPLHKVRYRKLELISSAIRDGKIVYKGRGSQLTIEPRDGAAPSYRIVPIAISESDALPRPVAYRLADGNSVKVVGTPVGSSHQPAGFSVGGVFYPVQVPSMELYRKMRPDDQASLEIENDIGPSLLAGSTIWFTNSFYDGEGTSGVGALGSFDVRTHKYEMRYLPEITHWSGSAIRLDGDSIWIGLKRQPEGAAYGGGLLRYDTRTGAVKKFPVADYISTIDRLGDAIYCGTSNGVYVIRGDAVTQLRFEPDASGKTVMISSRK